MKKLILTLFILTAMIGYTQTTHYANQVTITWDAPAEYINGDPLPVELELSYDVYIREKEGEQVLIETISNPPYTITFPNPNMKYDVGVLAKYPIGDDWLYSVILWSIQEGWDVGVFIPTAPVINMRIE